MASGLLTDRYLAGDTPTGSRGAELWGAERTQAQLQEAGVERLRALAGLARERGQTLAQLAIAWALRLPAVSTVLVGVSGPEQLLENAAALERLEFSQEELDTIDALTL